MGNPYVIAEPCVKVKDKACVPACPVDCIYEMKDGKLTAPGKIKEAAPGTADNQLYIHPDDCIS